MGLLEFIWLNVLVWPVFIVSHKQIDLLLLHLKYSDMF